MGSLLSCSLAKSHVLCTPEHYSGHQAALSSCVASRRVVDMTGEVRVLLWTAAALNLGQLVVAVWAPHHGVTAMHEALPECTFCLSVSLALLIFRKGVLPRSHLVAT